MLVAHQSLHHLFPIFASQDQIQLRYVQPPVSSLVYLAHLTPQKMGMTVLHLICFGSWGYTAAAKIQAVSWRLMAST